MTEAISAKIGFLTAISSASPHFNSFKALIPNDVRFDFIGLELVESSLYELKGRKETVLQKTLELAGMHQWQGVILSGAPVELLNPGLLDDLRSSLSIPVTTALAASVAALKRFSVKRALLMTPFDEPLNQMIRDYLANAEIEAFSPPAMLRHFTEALKLSAEEIDSLTKKALKRRQDVDAIYFQGAVLDPLKVLERMENELNTTVVASNPAMLWYMLSRLGLSYRIQGYGRLLAEWPKLPQ